MKKKANFNTLFTELEAKMSEQRYPDCSVKSHKGIWKLLIRYAEQKGYERVERSWVFLYMQEHYCDQNGNPLTVGYRNYFRSAEILCQFVETGQVSRKIKTKLAPVKCAIIEKLKAHLLENMRYSPRTVHDYNYTWEELSAYADTKGFTSFNREWVFPFMQERYGITERPLPHKERVQRRAAEILCDFSATGGFLQRRYSKQKIFSNEYDYIFSAMEKYCRTHRISKRTAIQMDYSLRSFVAYLESRHLKINALTVPKIRDYLLTLAHYAKKTIAMEHYTLRCVLRTLFENGNTSLNLSLACKHIKVPNDAKIPSAYSSQEVQAILESVDRSTALGKRNYAILLLAARLGIRVGDIRNLSFENFNFDTGEIRFFQGKTQNEIALPMSEEVGLAIIDYLVNGRPRSDCTYLFIRHLAPFGKFGFTQNFGNIINKHIVLSKIQIPKGKHHGMHSLRHSLASIMLSEGIPLPVISDVLGHSDTDVTRYYLKIDIEQLRKCALNTEMGGEL